MFKVLVVFLGLLTASLAFAHTHMKSSEPKAEALLSEAPQKVLIRLSEAVEPKLSKIQVTSESGERVDAGAPIPIQQGDDVGLEVPLKPALKPGKYRVEWKAVSKDTHKAQGSFEFTVSGKK